MSLRASLNVLGGGSTELAGGEPGFFTNVTATGQFLAANGTAAAPSYAWTNSADQGFYRFNSTITGFSSGGTASLLFTSNGRIFDSATSALLQLNGATGAASLTAGGTNQNVTLTPSGSGAVMIGAGANGYSFVDANGYGMYYGGGTQLAFHTASGTAMVMTGLNTLVGGLTTNGTGVLQFPAATTTAGGITFGTDTNLYRSGTGTVALNDVTNGTPGFIVINGFMSAVYRLTSTTNVSIGSNTTGCSTTIVSGNQVPAITIDSSQNATFATNITLPVSASYQWTGRSRILSDGDGLIRLNDAAGTNFSRLMFGGTTSSFPSLKRNSASLEVRLADDSGYSAIMVDNLRVTGTAVTAATGQVSYGASTASTVGAAGGASALPALPLGYIIINVAGTAAKIPYYNS